MKYIVAGGAGFIGSHIVDRLISAGHEVIVLDNLSTGKKENIHLSAVFIHIDLTQAESIRILEKHFSGVDAVFHCAALPNVQFSVEHPCLSNTANVDTTINILETMKRCGLSKIIYSSSSAVYGDTKIIPTIESAPIKPLSPYSLQKYIGELYCHLYHDMYNINYVIFRYFNVYGERMSDTGAYVSVLSHFLRSKRNNKPLNIVNTGEQKRDFVYVGDIADANILASLSNTADNRTMNLGSGKNYTVNKIADMFGISKKYGESRIEPFESLADITLSQSILGWKPRQDLQTWINKQLQT